MQHCAIIAYLLRVFSFNENVFVYIITFIVNFFLKVENAPKLNDSKNESLNLGIK